MGSFASIEAKFGFTCMPTNGLFTVPGAPVPVG